MMFLRPRMLTTIMKATPWRWLLRLRTVDCLNIYIHISADCSWNFGLRSTLCQDVSLIWSVVFRSIDLGYYQLFSLRIVETKVKINIIESRSGSSTFSFDWIGIEHALRCIIFFLGFHSNRFAAFTSMRGMFRLKTWRLCVVCMVERPLVGLYGPLTVFLNILVSKRHML